MKFMEDALPVRLWGLDPLYWTHVKLFVRDVLNLKNYPGFKGKVRKMHAFQLVDSDFIGVYAMSNHPIVQVLIVGYVVKVDKKEKLSNYGVDDGTGCVSCCIWNDQGKEIVEANFGDLVTVMGKITTFREERQITVSALYIEKDANIEVLHWLEVMRLRQIYEKPFETSGNSKTNHSKKPSHTNELETEIDGLEKSLKNAIVEYLESTDKLSFTLNAILSVTKITAISKQLSSMYKERMNNNKGKNASTSVSSTEVGQTIQHALKKLQKNGVVYCKPITDFNQREYEFISLKKDLSPRIVNIIKEISHEKGESSCGIPLSKIASTLKSFEKYKDVHRNRIREGLEYLMNNGDIYETRQEYYRTI